MYMSRLQLVAPAGLPMGLYTAHRALWTLFGDSPQRRRDFLFRELGDNAFLCVCARPPADPRGAWNIATKPYAPILHAEERLYFSLRANAVRKTRAPDGRQLRHDVVQDERIRRMVEGEEPVDRDTRLELAQAAGWKWLEKRQAALGLSLERDGFAVEAYRPEPLPGKSAKARLGTLDMTGFATVTDPEKLRQVLFTGVGPAKAFGCGLLLVRRA